MSMEREQPGPAVSGPAPRVTIRPVYQLTCEACGVLDGELHYDAPRALTEREGHIRAHRARQYDDPRAPGGDVAVRA